MSEQDEGPWHRGELELQAHVGVVARMDAVGRRFVRDAMPEQHREFFAQLPFVVLGTTDDRDEVWATLVVGAPGFMNSPTPRTLTLDADLSRDDPAHRGSRVGSSVGLLGIELPTRRRNRLNGVITSVIGTSFEVSVRQSFGNCPQYIQARTMRLLDAGASVPGEVFRASSLFPAARSLIEASDTFFVASYADVQGSRQVDVSHRGGRAGFVRVDDDGLLTIPDFAGNRFFNTLGNFIVNPRAGLLFVDFASGDVLQMTGEARVILDSPELDLFQGAERLWTFRPTRVVYRAAISRLRASFERWSPNSLMTGSWEQVRDRADAEAAPGSWRSFRVERVVSESIEVRSLWLAPADGVGLARHRAGQHIPVKVTSDGTSHIRTYTISTAASDGVYRISVKRQGLVSSRLHELAEGDLIEVMAPAGSFTIDATVERPAVMLAGGIGITPLLSMLRHVVYEGERTRTFRDVHLYYAARSKTARAFDDELRELSARAHGAVRITRFVSDVRGAVLGRDYDLAGRLSVDDVIKDLGVGERDYYLCGPSGFMRSLYDGLRSLEVPEEQIHAEAFGPAALERALDSDDVASGPVRVVFGRSARDTHWGDVEGETLLELAERRGLAPEHGCRVGSCGACRVRLVAGEVSYDRRVRVDGLGEDVLICCARPRRGTRTVELDL